MIKRKLPDLPAILLFFVMTALALVMTFLPHEPGGFDDAPRRKIDKMYLTLNDFELDNIKDYARGTEFEGNELVFGTGGEKKEFSNVTVKGRGNSTWGKPKVPFQMKLSQKAEFVGEEKSRKWVLLANYYDDSNIRNAVGQFTAEEIFDMPFPIRGDFVELYTNGNYQGLYYLTEKVEIGKGRVDLRDSNGIIMERRSGEREDAGDMCYGAKLETCLTIKDLVADDNEEVALQDFLTAFSKFETAIERGDLETARKYFDIESAVKYYLFSEFIVNPDAYIFSEYFYKDGEDDVIHMGPAWDFDFAFGNDRWVWNDDDEDYFSPTELNKNVPEKTFMYVLLQIPEFQAEVKELYEKTLKVHGNEVVEYAKAESRRVYLAATMNNIAWGSENFTRASNELIDWIKIRLDYLDGVFSEVVE